MVGEGLGGGSGQFNPSWSQKMHKNRHVSATFSTMYSQGAWLDVFIVYINNIMMCKCIAMVKTNILLFCGWWVFFTLLGKEDYSEIIRGVVVGGGTLIWPIFPFLPILHVDTQIWLIKKSKSFSPPPPWLISECCLSCVCTSHPTETDTQVQRGYKWWSVLAQKVLD